MITNEVAKDQFVDGGSPGIGRAIVLGTVVGVAVTFLGVGGACLAAGWPWTTALGLAAFSSVWSGFGFGFMFGGILYVTKLEALQEADRRSAHVSTRPEPVTTIGSGTRPTPMARPTSGSATLA